MLTNQLVAEEVEPITQLELTAERAVELGITEPEELETLHLHLHHKELTAADQEATLAVTAAEAVVLQDQLEVTDRTTQLVAAVAVLQVLLQDLQLHMLEVAEAVAELTQVMETLVADLAVAVQVQTELEALVLTDSVAAEVEPEDNLLEVHQLQEALEVTESQSCLYLQEIIQVKLLDHQV